MIIQTEEKDFYRDTSTRALINTNVKALKEHKLKKEQAARIEKLEDEMQCVLSLLQEIRTAIKDLGTGK